jgi:hypothetical protein
MLASRWQVAGMHLEGKLEEPAPSPEPLELKAIGPVDLVFEYRSASKIQKLAKRAEGRLRVVDAVTAYFRLKPHEWEPLELYESIKHVLRLPERQV